MSIRVKTLIVIASLALIMGLTTFFISQNIFMGRFSDLDKDKAETNVSRVVSAISTEINSLDTLNHDWSNWDDTYNFVEHPNQAYIDTNLTDETMANAGINVVTIIDSFGSIITSKAFDLENNQEISPWPSLREHLTNDVIAHHTDEQDSILGIVLLDEGPLMISSRPILTSTGEGPIAGTIIMGRFLGPAAVNDLAETVHLPFSLSLFNNVEMTPDLQTARSSLSEEKPTFIKTLNDKSIGGYALINDIYGTPALIIKAELPRDIYAEGKQTTHLFFLLMLALGIVFACATLLLLGRLVIMRLAKLSKDVASVGTTGNLSLRLQTSGKDEVSIVSDRINDMLSSLEQSQNNVKHSEEKLRLMFQSIEDGIIVNDLEGNITEINKAGARNLGYSNTNEVIGRQGADFVLPSDYFRLTEAWNKPVIEGQSKIGEFTFLRRGVTEFPVELSVATMKDISGNPSSFVAIIKDISERERAEKALRQSEVRFRSLVTNIPDVVWTANSKGKITFISPSVEKIMGYPHNVMYDDGFRIWLESIHPEDLCKVKEALTDLTQKRKTFELEYRFKRKDGEWVWFGSKTSVPYLKDDDTYFDGLTSDITERKKAEETLNQRNRELTAINALAQSLNHPMDVKNIFQTALDNVLQAAESQVGCIHLNDKHSGELTLVAYKGIDDLSLEDAYQRNLGGDIVTEAARTGHVISKSNVLNNKATKDNELAGDWEKMQSHISVPIKSKDNLLGVISLACDSINSYSPKKVQLLESIGSQIAIAIENAQLLDKLSNLSVTDELTGLYNRRHFYKMLESEMARTQRHGSSFCLAMLDIDGFKQYNDRFGHTNGDDVLRKFAETSKTVLRKEDAAFRYGGDEFAIILVATDTREAKIIIERLRSELALKSKEQYSASELPLAFSSGIAQYPDDSKTGDGLIFLADTALYYSKRQGKDRSTLVSDLGTASTDALGEIPLDQIYALAATVDARDTYTYGHSKRISSLCEMTGTALGLSQKDLADLRAASLLHDIGKVGVPDSILSKPGKLMDDEYQVIQEHPVEGARIVNYIKALSGLTPFILHHHERYDGTGYPKGLKGHDIPLGARIIAVADAYDAMTTTRPYKGVISQKSALEELRRCSGSQFDPEVVEAFCVSISKITEDVEQPVLIMVK